MVGLCRISRSAHHATAGNFETDVLPGALVPLSKCAELRGRLKPKTVLLWIGPFLTLLIGGVVVVLFARRRRGAAQDASTHLSTEERARLDRLLNSGPMS
ncbi:cytochrome c-type biogenesis protein CcmH (plasmid) [Nitratireductor rhodophyticola]|uniref:cytochrome c-type biogenesis protein CcmH n=1 Tax=Nitratireductor TaxID=245876 RepID=UPI000C89C498|nr:cytochrome c-type biogenesis protein CcmH [Nitratireductor rhodophyticola]MAS15452.1 hypothetical protein [Nitratireductor sp.]MEC9245854.1 cytochrome c-type biogenesis protein CcmH [Pseudomonadota bacterium]WPZ16429.1 cytochrome c-type biogenesis protein CcmH [Nitratireductor rhodophyticola]